MNWDIQNSVVHNSFDYFEKTLITDNGFREYDCRWLLGKEINPNGFFVLGRAYGTMARRELGEKRVIVGHDFRSYSQDLCRSFILGLISTGAHVIDIGLALTPMVYFAQHHFQIRAAAMCTASHNENGWTGLKLADGLSSTFSSDEMRRFKEIAHAGDFERGKGVYESCGDLEEAYRQDILRRADHGGRQRSSRLRKACKIVLAAGNGTAGRFAPKILEELGCKVVPLDCAADWDFPRFNPNPEDVSFLKEISRVTLEEGADIGIGLDGDGDRMGVIDDKGREIFSDKLGLLLARWLSKSHPNRKVVIDVKSTGLFNDDPVLKKNGVRVVIWKTGHSFIKAKVEETNAIAGFEKSGHWFFNSPIGLGYDDAILSSVQLLKMLDESDMPLSQRVDDLPRTWQSPTIGAYCPDDAKYEVVKQVTESYRQDQKNGTRIGGSCIKELITLNGVRFVLKDDSWGLVRASSNKPSLILVAESKVSENQLKAIMDHIQSRLDDSAEVGERDQEMPPRSMP